MIRSAQFSIAASTIAARMARQWIGRRWLFFAIPVAMLLLAGYADLRFAIVALMLIFILWPMALSFVWFGRALSPASVKAAQPHTVVFSEYGLAVEYAVRDGYFTPPTEHVAMNLIAGIEDCGRYIIIKLRDADPVIVPAYALAAEDWCRVRKLLDSDQSVISES